MHTTTIASDGSIRLDTAQLRALGYRPGRVVQVVVASTGTLLVSLDDAPVTVEVPARALPARERRMLGAGR